MRDMPEILFRGKRVDNGEWIYGCPIYFPPGKPFIATRETLMRGNAYEANIFTCSEEIIPETMGRYTGLIDKNGVKIFEGDIVKTEGLDEDYWFEVCYGICGGTQNVLHEVGYIGFYLQPKNKAAKEYSSFGLRNDIVYWVKQKESVEVIGNIHDNPELLEEGGER